MTDRFEAGSIEEGASESHESEHVSGAVDAVAGNRLLPTLLGGSLVVLGLKRRTLGGTVAALVGGALLVQEHSGRDRLYRTPDRSGTAGRGRETPGASADSITVKRSTTVSGDPEELYEFWRDPEELNRIMGHVAEVSAVEGEHRFRWTIDGPLGRSASWETRTVDDNPGEFIRWESLEGAAVPNEGSVNFRSAPAGRGTEVTLRVDFDPPGGAIGDVVIRRLGIAPETLVSQALRRFKSLAETDEIPTLDRNPSARGKGDLI